MSPSHIRIILRIVSNRFFRELLTIFTHRPISFIKSNLTCFYFTGMLTGSQVLSTFGSIKTIKNGAKNGVKSNSLYFGRIA